MFHEFDRNYKFVKKDLSQHYKNNRFFNGYKRSNGTVIDH